MKRFFFGHHKCGSRYFRSLNEKLKIRSVTNRDYFHQQVVLRNLDELDLASFDQLCRSENSIVSFVNSTERLFDRFEQEVNGSLRLTISFVIRVTS